MTDDTTVFHPPLASGLASDGEPYLSERIEARHDLTPTQARTPGVYALTLSVPQNVDLEDYWLTHYDALPDYWSELTNAQRIVYVGAAKDTYGRVEEHLASEKRRAVLPSVFPPHTLHRVWLYEDADRAFLKESNHAIELANQHDDWFVHQS